MSVVNIELFDNIYELLNQNKNLIRYSPTITKDSRKVDNKFPRVLLVEVNNIDKKGTTRYEESTKDLYYTIFIYAEDVYEEDGSIVPRIDVARRIWKDIDTILDSIKITRLGTAQPINNLDNSVYELALDYKVSLNSRNLFI